MRKRESGKVDETRPRDCADLRLRRDHEVARLEHDRIALRRRRPAHLNVVRACGEREVRGGVAVAKVRQERAIDALRPNVHGGRIGRRVNHAHERHSGCTGFMSGGILSIGALEQAEAKRPRAMTVLMDMVTSKPARLPVHEGPSGPR